MSKNPGKKFEEDFIASVPETCDITRLKDAGGWGNATNMRFTIDNPCDFVIYSSQTKECYKLELKSFKGKSLPYGNIKTDPIKRLKFLKDLADSERKGVAAAFVCNFRDLAKTFIVSAIDVKDFVQHQDRKSIPLDWFEDHGTLVQQTIKRTRYSYNLEWL